MDGDGGIGGKYSPSDGSSRGGDVANELADAWLGVV